MILPTEDKCLQYFDEYKVPSNIKKHCVYVTKVAVFLAEELNKKGVVVNVDLVRCAGLMHDMFKVVVLEKLEPSEQYHPEPFTDAELEMWKTLRAKFPDMWESQVAYEIFKNQFPELALTVKNSSDPHVKEKSWEELIVHYADFRVLQEAVVLLQKRLDYMEKTYPHQDDSWQRYREVMLENEMKIFSKLPFQPDELKERINGR